MDSNYYDEHEEYLKQIEEENYPEFIQFDVPIYGVGEGYVLCGVRLDTFDKIIKKYPEKSFDAIFKELIKNI